MNRTFRPNTTLFHESRTHLRCNIHLSTLSWYNVVNTFGSLTSSFSVGIVNNYINPCNIVVIMIKLNTTSSFSGTGGTAAKRNAKEYIGAKQNHSLAAIIGNRFMDLSFT